MNTDETLNFILVFSACDLYLCTENLIFLFCFVSFSPFFYIFSMRFYCYCVLMLRPDSFIDRFIAWLNRIVLVFAKILPKT